MKGTKFLSSKAILGIVTAVAVVGSFAAWDKLSDNSTGTVTPRASVTTSVSAATFSLVQSNDNKSTVSDWNTTYYGTTTPITFTIAGLSGTETGLLTLTGVISDENKQDLEVKLYSDAAFQNELTTTTINSTTKTQDVYVKVIHSTTASSNHTNPTASNVSVTATLSNTTTSE